MKKQISLILALLMLAPTVLASCADSGSGDETKGTESNPAGESETPEETETENPYYEGYVDPFAGVSFNGDTFRVHNSSNVAATTMIGSAYLIEGPEDYAGDAAANAAYERNAKVEVDLGIDLVFDQYDYSWSQTASNIRTLITTGDTSYDLIINDMLGLVPIASEGLFYNVSYIENFDYNGPWWYDDFMKDIALNDNLRFALAGDFFIDMLRTSHALFMNKDVYTNMNIGDPEEVYEIVLNGDWTIDKLNEMASQCYVDTDGSQVADAADQYGILLTTSWGPLLPFMVSADPGFIERGEDGYPTITVNNERSVALVDKLYTMCSAPYNSANIYDEPTVIQMFTQGQSLFLGYQRLGTLESPTIRESEVGLAVLPYPKLDDLQENYVTSCHDTSELGFIPMTVSDDRIDFVTTVIEILCRETYAQVLPIYYEESLKVRYTRDEASGQMIDIIHDNFGNGFALAFSSGLNDIFLEGTIAAAAMSDPGTFASKVRSSTKVANKLLEAMIKDCEDLLAEQGLQ